MDGRPKTFYRRGNMFQKTVRDMTLQYSLDKNIVAFFKLVHPSCVIGVHEQGGRVRRPDRRGQAGQRLSNGLQRHQQHRRRTGDRRRQWMKKKKYFTVLVLTFPLVLISKTTQDV